MCCCWSAWRMVQGIAMVCEAQSVDAGKCRVSGAGCRQLRQFFANLYTSGASLILASIFQDAVTVHVLLKTSPLSVNVTMIPTNSIFTPMAILLST